LSRLLWIVENFFTYGGKKFHELLFCFEMAVPYPVDLQAEFRGTEGFRATEGTTELTFRWCSLDGFTRCESNRPSFVRPCASSEVNRARDSARLSVGSVQGGSKDPPLRRRQSERDEFGAIPAPLMATTMYWRPLSM
jgi:hypothetical protein